MKSELKRPQYVGMKMTLTRSKSESHFQEFQVLLVLVSLHLHDISKTFVKTKESHTTYKIYVTFFCNK